MFGLGQTKKKKATEKKVNETKNQLKNITITDTVEGAVRKDQFSREKNEKDVQRKTIAELKDVTITDTIEGEVRKEQHSREQDWKATGKQQKVANTNFDMARALFS